MGLSLPMKDVQLDLEVSPPLARFTGEIDDDVSRWAFRSLNPSAGHIVGVAAALPANGLEIVPIQTRAINMPTGH